jgi:Outer membrane protein beta-barrel domain
MRSFILLFSAGFLAASFLYAQEAPKYTYSFGAGFTQPIGFTASQLGTGWNIGGNVGYKLTPSLGANVDLGLDDLGVYDSTLASIGVKTGSVHIFSATLDPVVHLHPHGRVDFYLTGGGGLFRWEQEFGLADTAIVPGYSPFFELHSVGVPANQILTPYSVNRPGFDIGAGVEFGAIAHGKFFAEAKYDHIYMTNSHVDYLPVTFGLRW